MAEPDNPTYSAAAAGPPPATPTGTGFRTRIDRLLDRVERLCYGQRTSAERKRIARRSPRDTEKSR